MFFNAFHAFHAFIAPMRSLNLQTFIAGYFSVFLLRFLKFSVFHYFSAVFHQSCGGNKKLFCRNLSLKSNTLCLGIFFSFDYYEFGTFNDLLLRRKICKMLKKHFNGKFLNI